MAGTSSSSDVDENWAYGLLPSLHCSTIQRIGLGSRGSIWFDGSYYSRPNSQGFLLYEGGSSTEGDRRYSGSNRQSIHILRGMMAVWSMNWSACTATSPFFLNRHVDYPCRYGHASFNILLVSWAVEKPESNNSGTLVVEPAVWSRRVNLSGIWCVHWLLGWTKTADLKLSEGVVTVGFNWR